MFLFYYIWSLTTLLSNFSAAFFISTAWSPPKFRLSFFLYCRVFFFNAGVCPSNTKTGFIPKKRSLSIRLRNPSTILNSFVESKRSTVSASSRFSLYITEINYIAHILASIAITLPSKSCIFILRADGFRCFHRPFTPIFRLSTR